jgi:hypothetical protein
MGILRATILFISISATHLLPNDRTVDDVWGFRPKIISATTHFAAFKSGINKRSGAAFAAPLQVKTSGQ